MYVGARMRYPPTNGKQDCPDPLNFNQWFVLSEHKGNAAPIRRQREIQT